MVTTVSRVTAIAATLCRLALAALLFAPLAASPQAPWPSPRSPCLSRPEHAQLDFWIGQWDVVEGGKVVGRSTVERRDGGCVIVESFQQGGAFTGTSVNFFDRALGKWRQTWADSGGNASEFSGEFRDGAMRFEGESHRAGGERVLRRMTLLDEGRDRVRSRSERSDDGGRTWRVNYEFRYLKRR